VLTTDLEIGDPVRAAIEAGLRALIEPDFHEGPPIAAIRALIATYDDRRDRILAVSNMRNPILWVIDRHDPSQEGPCEPFAVVIETDEPNGIASYLTSARREAANADLDAGTDQEWWLQYHERFENIHQIVAYHCGYLLVAASDEGGDAPKTLAHNRGHQT
jgi:hypothetical protein